ncbi:MAG: hypothetical protein IR160_04960 [Salinibacterium sp.]|nr:hypothetical protein [Salinibacterium sp.]MBF0671919.1 hypothetical protein [Salinibacterium sp.]
MTTRYAIDAGTALRIIRSNSDADRRHHLVAPALLRSDVLSALYRDVRAGRISEVDGKRQLERLTELKLRLLGDRMSRAASWRFAMRLGWDDTATAEYLAVASLQADVLVTDDVLLAAGAEGIVPVVPWAGFDT